MKNCNHSCISRQEALRLILERSQFEIKVEIIPIREALGRVTAHEILAVNTLPNSPSSAMDGIAIKSINLNGGISNTADWQVGVHYVFSNTGVGIPDEYDTVVLIEDVEIDDAGRLQIMTTPRLGQNVRPVGEAMQAGDVLVPSYFCLGPAQLGLLTAGGVGEVEVLEKPKVAILPTGNELVQAGVRPPRGKNVESNGIMMEAQVKLIGAEPRLYPITQDNTEDLVQVLNDALSWADIVIFNGGSSKGSDDRAIEVLETVGQILVYEVDYGPGKHTTLTVAGSKPIVGAVGPTLGAEYAVEWYVAPLINKYLFQPNIALQSIKVKLLEEIHAPMPFDFYARLVVERLDEGYGAKLAGPRNGPIAKAMMANAYLRVPGEVKGYKAGEIVEVELKYPLEWIGFSNNPESQYQKGMKIISDLSEIADYSEAVSLFREAALEEHPGAQYELGVSYCAGRGIEQSSEKALQWFFHSAKHGYPKSLHNLGVRYSIGKNVDKDPVQAASYFLQAADRGHALAQFKLAVMYKLGWGVERGGEEAGKWFGLAGNIGINEVKCPLSVLIEMENDRAEWFKEAMKQGYIGNEFIQVSH